MTCHFFWKLFLSGVVARVCATSSENSKFTEATRRLWSDLGASATQWSGHSCCQQGRVGLKRLPTLVQVTSRMTVQAAAGCWQLASPCQHQATLTHSSSTSQLNFLFHYPLFHCSWETKSVTDANQRGKNILFFNPSDWHSLYIFTCPVKLKYSFTENSWYIPPVRTIAELSTFIQDF